MLVSKGHLYEDIRNKYTISQVYLFAEKIKKMTLDRNRMDAIIMSNCMVYTSPVEDMVQARIKNKRFNAFLDTLNWDRLVSTEEKKRKSRSAEQTLKSLFGGVNLPIKIRGKK
jgi:hypothetical protein